MPTNNQWYTVAFRNGMLDACNGVTPDSALAHAKSLGAKTGDAYLAGYDAENRKMRRQEENEDSGQEEPSYYADGPSRFEDSPRYRNDMIAAGRGRLVR